MFLRVIRPTAALVTLVLAVGRTAVLQAQSESLVDIRNLTPRELRAAAFVLTSPQSIRIEAVGAEPRRDTREGRWWSSGDNDDTWPAAAWILDARTREVVWDLRAARTERTGDGLRRFAGGVDLPAGTYLAYYGSFVVRPVSSSARFDVASLFRSARGRPDVRYGGPYVDDGSFRQFGLEIHGAGRPAAARELDSLARVFNATTVAALRPDTPSASLRTAFTVSRPTAMEISATGELRGDDAFDYGWIVNADTRRRVWEMRYRHSEAAGGVPRNRMVRDTLRLPSGRYVAYFVNDDSHDPGDWNAVPPFDPESWGLTLRVTNPAERAAVRVIDWEPVPAGQTIVSLTGIGDNELRSEGFTLRQAMDVRVYALGEGADRGGEMNDYAWIVDATARRRVWSMRYEETEDAGGATKNRLFDGALHLDAGSYVVYFKSDDSHSFEKWNAAPPAESRYWGVSLVPASGPLDRSAIAPFEPGHSNAIVELLRVRSGWHPHTPFTLDRAALVRVLAIGEGIGGEMYDYGWIENAETGERVWAMTYGATTNAGGARKNRLFDGAVRLPAGRYELHYETDGSHAYGGWNDDPPDDPEAWGITLLPDSGR
jgi:hypothetical protein